MTRRCFPGKGGLSLTKVPSEKIKWFLESPRTGKESNSITMQLSVEIKLLYLPGRRGLSLTKVLSEKIGVSVCGC